MSIWFKEFTLEQLIPYQKNTLIENLGIEFSEIGDDYVVARMPVDHRTRQPAGPQETS